MSSETYICFGLYCSCKKNQGYWLTELLAGTNSSCVGYEYCCLERMFGRLSRSAVSPIHQIWFPLSLVADCNWFNTEVENHFSAKQHQVSVKDYLDKENQLKAILGPVDKVEFESFHCSPLLTRPKDGNKRQIILGF